MKGKNIMTKNTMIRPSSANEIEVWISPKCDLSDYLTVGLNNLLFTKLLGNRPKLRITLKELPKKQQLFLDSDDEVATLFSSMATCAFPVFLKEYDIPKDKDRSAAFEIIEDINMVLKSKLSYENFFEKWYINLPQEGDPFGDTYPAEQCIQQVLDCVAKTIIQ